MSLMGGGEGIIGTRSSPMEEGLGTLPPPPPPHTPPPPLVMEAIAAVILLEYYLVEY